MLLNAPLPNPRLQEPALVAHVLLLCTSARTRHDIPCLLQNTIKANVLPLLSS